MIEKNTKDGKVSEWDSPFYLLSTLAGDLETAVDESVIYDNKILWNRFAILYLKQEDILDLLKKNRITEEELTPLSEVEFSEILSRRTGVKPEVLKRAEDIFKVAHSGKSIFDNIDFANVEFSDAVFFGGYIFPIGTSFEGAVFGGGAHFTTSIFLSDTYFSDAQFVGQPSFSSAIFEDFIMFDDAVFSDTAYFDDICTKSKTSFYRAVFKQEAVFSHSTFEDMANFSNVDFQDLAEFDGTNFYGRANFVNGSFGSTTDFRGARFVIPPEFQGRRMHPDTIWPDKEELWPKNDWKKNPDAKNRAKDYERAWASLKWSMNQVQRHDSELDFFARELEAKFIYASPPKKVVLFLFSHFSNYGRSALRPFIWWIGFWLFAFLSNYWLLFSRFPNYTFEHGAAVTDFTFGNAFSLGGIYTAPERRQELAAKVFVNGDASQVSPLIDLLSLGHSFASLLFIFLIGLALRNRLRIK